MSLIRPQWISNHAKAEASALLSGKTRRFRGHCSFRTAREDRDWKSAGPYYNTHVLKNDTSDPHSQNPVKANSDNILEKLGNAI